MSTQWGPHGRRFVTLAFGLGVMFVAAQSGSDSAAEAGSSGVRCKIQVEKLGDRVELQGMVIAKSAMQGSYQMQVSKSGDAGQSSINQAGDFEAAANAETPLGLIQLGGDGGGYRAKLKVMWDGEAIECEETVGGGWL